MKLSFPCRTRELSPPSYCLQAQFLNSLPHKGPDMHPLTSRRPDAGEGSVACPCGASPSCCPPAQPPSGKPGPISLRLDREEDWGPGKPYGANEAVQPERQRVCGEPDGMELKPEFTACAS